MPRNSCTSPPASASDLRLGTYRVQGRPSRAFRVQGLRPCPLQLDQSHVGSLTLAERPRILEGYCQSLRSWLELRVPLRGPLRSN